MERVVDSENVRNAWKRVKANHGALLKYRPRRRTTCGLGSPGR